MKKLADGIQFPVELTAAPESAKVEAVAMRPKKIVSLAPKKGMLAEMGFSPVAEEKQPEQTQV